MSKRNKYNNISCLCDGLRCNPYDECGDAEKLACRTIIQKVIPSENFIGQFPVFSPNGNYRLDFAIKTPDGRALAVEIDGYESHAKLTNDGFNRQLARQNEFVLAGWSMLRFTFQQITGAPSKCIENLKKLYEKPLLPQKLAYTPMIFADLKMQMNDNDSAKAKGATYSRKKKIWYAVAPSAKAFDEFKQWNPDISTVCLDPVCQGKLYWRDGRHGIFWSCDSCDKTFSDDDGHPIGAVCLNPNCLGWLNRWPRSNGYYWKCKKCKNTFDDQNVRPIRTKILNSPQ